VEGFLGHGFITGTARSVRWVESAGCHGALQPGRGDWKTANDSRVDAVRRRERAFHSPSSSHQAVSPSRGFQTPIILSFSASLRLCARSLLQGSLPRVRAAHDPGLSAPIPSGCLHAGGVGAGLGSKGQGDEDIATPDPWALDRFRFRWRYRSRYRRVGQGHPTGRTGRRRPRCRSRAFFRAMRTSPPRIHVLWIVFDSDGDTDPDTDAGGDGIRQEERGGDVHVAVPEPSSGL
jgi:hypothetical protein